RPATPVLVQLVVADGPDADAVSGLAAMLRTAHLEHPWLWGQMISVAPGLDAAELARCLDASARTPQWTRIRHRGDGVEVASWCEVSRSGAANPKPWRDDGIYLITGGAGALG